MPSPWAIRQTLLLIGITPLEDLPSLPFSASTDLPNGPGVYIVCANIQALYVGATKSLVRRVTHHPRAHDFHAHGCTHIAWWLYSETATERLDSYEEHYIKAYVPVLNDARQHRYPSTVTLEPYTPIYDMPRKPMVRRKDPSAPPKKVAPNRITELRVQHGLSAQALAATLRINRVTLWKWENSHEYPSWKALENLARFFQVPPIHIIPILAERSTDESTITTPKEA